MVKELFIALHFFCNPNFNLNALLKTQILPEMSCWYPCGPDRGKCRPQEDPEHQSGKLNSSIILITLVADSYDQLKMTNHVLCKMTNLDFEDEQPLSSKPWIASKHCGWLSSSPSLLCLHYTCLALLALLTLNFLLNTTWKVKSLKEVNHLSKSVGHLTRYPIW